MECANGKAVFLIVFYDIIEFISDLKSLMALELVCQDFAKALYTLKGATARNLYQRVITSYEATFILSSDDPFPITACDKYPEELIMSTFEIFCKYEQPITLKSRPPCWYSLMVARSKYRSSLGHCFISLTAPFISFDTPSFDNEPTIIDIQWITLLQMIEEGYGQFQAKISGGLQKIPKIMQHRVYVNYMLNKLPAMWNDYSEATRQGINFIKQNIQILAADLNYACADDHGAATSNLEISFGGINGAGKQFSQFLFYNNDR